MGIALLLAGALFAAPCLAQYVDAPTPDDFVSEYGTAAYAYQPSLNNNSATTTTLGAQTQNRDEPQMPVLEGSGIAQNSFLLAACALRTPHVHPNANGLLYVVNAASLEVGFVTVNGTLVNNTLASGGTTLFPIGLLHYQFNTGCSDATYTISYTASDPQTQNAVAALLKLPVDLVATALGTTTDAITALKSGTPSGNFVQRDPACIARCGAQTSGNLTSTLPSGTVQASG